MEGNFRPNSGAKKEIPARWKAGISKRRVQKDSNNPDLEG